MSEEAPKKKRKRAEKTPPSIEEALVARYLIVQSYAKVAAEFGMPRRTVVDVVKRKAGDALAELRLATRADLIQDMADAVREELLPLVKRGNFGGGAVSAGSEASRALADLVRSMALLEPKDKEIEAIPPTIVINTGVPMSAEEARATAAEAQDSTLPKLPQ